MTTKRANWLFLTVILVHIGVVLAFSFIGEGITISILANFILAQGMVIVPTLVFVFIFERESRQPAVEQTVYGVPLTGSGVRIPFEAAGFHKIKISTLLMIIPCTFLIMPLVVVLNALSLFFTDNTMASMQGDIVDMPFALMLFMIGIFGPFCEEFVFRGVIYRSYRRDDWDKDNSRYENGRNGGLQAIFLSAFLFGLMHMNLNQMIYAFAMGVFLALLVEAAGSLWASVFCHMFFNSVEVILMYASRRFLDNIYGRAAETSAVALTTQELLAALSLYLVIAAVTTPIAGCIIVWLAKNEGRQQAFSALFFRRKKQGVFRMQNGQETHYLLSVPLIVAIVLCLGYMSLEFFFW